MIRDDATGVTLDVLVTPRASKAKFGPVHGDRIKVAVTAPPVEGAANKAVIEMLAKRFGRPKADVNVIGGHSGRRKTVRIKGITRAAVIGALE